MAISLLSITTLTSYALFTNEAEGTNSISLKVSTKGKISIRIYTQDDGTEIGTLNKHENKIYFDVKPGFIADTNNITCNTGEPSYDKISNILTIKNATQNGECSVNFIAGYNTLYDAILSEPLTKTNDGLAITTQTNSTKPSYYYKGNVTNNYVSFAGHIWRIIRTNEDDKSIRIIKSQSIGSHAYTLTDGPNYRYYSNTYASCGVKKILEDWYNTNLLDYDSKIVQARYCEEEKINVGDSTISNGNAITISKNKYIPSLKCQTDGNGYGQLNLKIGLITADEALLIGIPFAPEEASNSYLNSYILTMTPIDYRTSDSHALIYMIGTQNLATADSNYPLGIVPVINLKADTLIEKGNGSMNNPYVVH